MQRARASSASVEQSSESFSASRSSFTAEHYLVLVNRARYCSSWSEAKKRFDANRSRKELIARLLELGRHGGQTVAIGERAARVPRARSDTRSCRGPGGILMAATHKTVRLVAAPKGKGLRRSSVWGARLATGLIERLIYADASGSRTWRSSAGSQGLRRCASNPTCPAMRLSACSFHMPEMATRRGRPASVKR